MLEKNYSNYQFERLFKLAQREFQLKGKVPKCYSCNYLLDGLYSYEDVISLNFYTSGNCLFALTDKIGPVAFIGLKANSYLMNNNFFSKNIMTYSHDRHFEEVYFHRIADEKAKEMCKQLRGKEKIFTVYGVNGVEDVSMLAPIRDLCYFYDTRSIYKQYMEKYLDYCRMDYKLKGNYKYKEALSLVVSPDFDFRKVIPNIVFAVVDDKHPIAIINMRHSADLEEKKYFYDVWEYGKPSPLKQSMYFLTDEEARDINDFEVYVYQRTVNDRFDYIHNIDRIDRMLDLRFKFKQPDGKDLRIKYEE